MPDDSTQANPQRAATGQGPLASAANMRQDDDRRREEARAATLQSQVDELRQALRELASRQTRDNEHIKTQETTIAQLRLTIEQLRQEAQQSAQARALDENRTRQEVGDLEARIEDATRPVRSLQAHVSELLEASRRKVDDSQQTLKRFDEVETIIEHLSAVGDRTSAISHSLREAIEAIRGEVDGLHRDIIRAEDAVKIVDQEGRRRATEVIGITDGYSTRIDELRADLAHLYDSLEDTRRGLVHVDPTLDELRAGELQLRQDLNRLQGQSQERHDLLIDVQDDHRQETDARFEQLRVAIEERIERVNERLEESGEGNRELSYKLSDVNSALEELRQVDASLHRDIWFLHEQRVRVRLEQVQEELDTVTSQRRDAETEAQVGLGSKFRRRRVVVSDTDS
jgi:chromosome segregation ATPase